MNRALRTAIATLIAALSVAAMIDAAPAKASVGSMSATLHDIWFYTPECGSDPALRYVYVYGVIPTSTYEEALTLNNYNRGIQVSLWGDDPVWDNLLAYALPWETSQSPASDGLHFEAGFCVPRSKLNEDSCWCDNRDEIYAGVRLVSHAGTTVRSAETNRKYGYF